MTRMGVRELRQHASRYLDELEWGGRIEVTERGQRVSPSPARTVRARLPELASLFPASQPYSLPPPQSLPAGVLTASEVLQELRAERP